MADGFALYGRLIVARVRAQMQYRVSFALETIGMFVISFLDFVAILIIFGNVPQLGRWSVQEVAFLYATSCLSFAFTDLAIGHLDLLSGWVRDGSFDLVLVRPRGTLYQIVTADFQLRRLGKVAQALVVLAYALGSLHIEWTGGRAAMFVLMIPAGTLIFASVWVATVCIVFWVVDGQQASNVFTYGGQYLSEFPVNIYDRWVRRFLAYVVPMAFVAYFPSLYVLGKADELGLPDWLQLTSPLVALAAAAVASLIWRGAVRHYQSAGG